MSDTGKILVLYSLNHSRTYSSREAYWFVHIYASCVMDDWLT